MDRNFTQMRQATNKGQRTASRILDVAEALFAQNGYGATSLRDIATQAGVQQPGIYKHFTGKEDLYQKVYERALEPMTKLMDTILAGPHGGFDDLTDRMTDLLAAHPNIARLLLRAATSPDSETDFIALDWLSSIVDYGRKLSVKAGASSSDSLLAVQTVAIFNMLFGFFWASPLIERLAGMPTIDTAAIGHQKGLLRRFISAMAQPD